MFPEIIVYTEIIISGNETDLSCFMIRFSDVIFTAFLAKSSEIVWNLIKLLIVQLNSLNEMPRLNGIGILRSIHKNVVVISDDVLCSKVL